MPLVSTWQADDAASSRPLARSSEGKKKNRTKVPECSHSPCRAGRRWWEQEGPQGRQEGSGGGGDWKGHGTWCLQEPAEPGADVSA